MMLGNHKQSSEILGNVSSENEKESQGSKPRVNYITTGKTASTIKSKISFLLVEISMRKCSEMRFRKRSETFPWPARRKRVKNLLKMVSSRVQLSETFHKSARLCVILY